MKQPEKRLGYKGAKEIKDHAFFEGVDWEMVIQKKLDPPHKPKVQSAIDLS